MVLKNIKYVITVFSLLAITSYCIDKLVYFGINYVANKVYSGQSIGKLNQYLKVKDSVDLLVYGSSRANHSINPSQLEKKSFNMGVDGQKIAFSATLVKLLATNNEQTLLFHIDPEDAVDSKYSAEDLSSLKVLYNENSLIKNELDKFERNNSFQFFYWCIAYNGNLLGILKNYIQPSYDYRQYNGYDPIRVSDYQKMIFNKIIKNKKKAKTAKCDKDFKLNPIYENYLADLKNFSKAKEKNIIFFTSPVFIDDCKEDNRFMRKKMKKMGLTYYDFTNLYDGKSSYEDWKDFTHLSSLGADKFTDTIQKVIFEK